LGIDCLHFNLSVVRFLGDRSSAFASVEFILQNSRRFCFYNVFGFHLFTMASDTRVVFLVPNVGVYNLVDGNYNIAKQKYLK